MKCQNCGAECDGTLCSKCIQIKAYESLQDDDADELRSSEDSDSETYDSFIRSLESCSESVADPIGRIKRSNTERRMFILLKLSANNVDKRIIRDKLESFDKLIVNNVDKIYGKKVDLIIKGVNEIGLEQNIIAEDNEHGIMITESIND